MAKYTVTLKSICEEISGLISSPTQAISISRPIIFDFEYPLYTDDNPNRKSELETKILKWYYLREIGLPTMSIWKWQLENRLNEIMPYYNELYRTAYELIRNRPDIEYSNTRHEVGTGTTETSNVSKTASNTLGANTDSTTSIGTDNTLNTASDLPQGKLTDFEDKSYLSAASKAENSNSNNSTATGTSSSDYKQDTSANASGSTTNVFDATSSGHNTNVSTLIGKYREQIMNVDAMIIHDLAELFMGVW